MRLAETDGGDRDAVELWAPGPATDDRVKHLLSVDDLDRAGIEELLDRSRARSSRSSPRDIPKVPALRGKTVVTLFYEDSTRTRLSFETAAKRLSADTMNFTRRRRRR